MKTTIYVNENERLTFFNHINQSLPSKTMKVEMIIRIWPIENNMKIRKQRTIQQTKIIGASLPKLKKIGFREDFQKICVAFSKLCKTCEYHKQYL